MPGTDGLVHISQLAPERVSKVSDVLKEGDEVMVKVLEIDRQGKIRLSRKEALARNRHRLRRRSKYGCELLSMFAKTVLDNGIRVVSHEMQDHRSVSLGIWVENGSRHESDAENGISHFIEHFSSKAPSGAAQRRSPKRWTPSAA